MSKPTILLIESDPSSIEATIAAFAESGANVQVAMDGESGLEAFRQIRPDLVIVETMVPRRHGFEVCRTIKDDPRGPATPVIVTAATYRGDAYRTKALGDFGADEYLEKPVDYARLADACRRLLPDAARPAARPDATPTPAASPAAPARASAGMPALDHLSEDEIMGRLDDMIDALVDPEDDVEAPAPAARPAPAPAARPAPAPVAKPVPAPVAKPAPPPGTPSAPEATFEDAVQSLEDAAVRRRAAEPPAAEPAPTGGRRGLPIAVVLFLLLGIGGAAAWFLVPRPAATTEPVRATPSPVPARDAAPPAAVASPEFPEATPADAASRPDDPPTEVATPVRDRPTEVAAKPTAEATARPIAAAPPPIEKPVRLPRRAEIDVDLPAHLATPTSGPTAPAPDLTAASMEAELEAILPAPEPPRIARGALVGSTDVDSEPRLVRRVAPEYPALARRMRQEGIVLLTVLVDENGAVADVEVPGAGKVPLLEKAATEAVRQWTYAPATRDGVEVRTWISVRINFAL